MVFSAGQKVNRLGVFSFFDKQGIADDYVLYLLRQMRPSLKKLLVICNGNLTEESRQHLETVADVVLVRENIGFDIWGYKEGIAHFGWDEVCTYDELILFNDTVYGPVYPFEDMFSEMDGQDLDFWGITVTNGAEATQFEEVETEEIPAHLHSYFLAVRQHMLQSALFQKYWNNLPAPEQKLYTLAANSHEIVFTKTFEEQGFKWSSYVDTKDIPAQITSSPLMIMPVELIKNRKCPVVKRQLFFEDMQYSLSESMGEHGVETLQYLKKHTDYDTDMILKNIIRTQNQSDIKNCLHLNYILSSDLQKNTTKPTPKAALFLHLYYDDEIDFCRKYAASMPKYADIIVTTDTEEKKQRIEAAFEGIACNHFQVDIIRNWARDVGAFLIGFKKYVNNYEYICFAHDKKGRGLDIQSNGYSFAYNCFESILKSPAYVENIIQTFEENPLLGLLAPPNPINGNYYSIFGFEWQGNFQRCKDLAGQMGLQVDMDPLKPPVAPIGSEFWFRSAALRPLFDFGFSYDNLPETSTIGVEDLLNAIERIHPFVVQSQGYYSAWVMPDTLASIQITDLFYYMRRIHYGWNHHTRNHAMLFPGMLKQIEFPEDSIADLEKHIEWQKKQLDMRDEDLSWLKAQVDDRDKDTAWLKKQVDDRDKGTAWLKKQVDDRDKDITWLKNQVNAWENDIAWLKKQIEARDNDINWLKGQLEK